MSVLIPSLYMLAGIVLYAGVNHALLGAQYVGRRTVHLLAATMCLLAVVFVATNIDAFTAESALAFARSRRINIAVTSAFAIVQLWFVAYYTGNVRRRWLLPLTVLTMLVMAINLAMPYSISFDELPQLVPIRLPWGEVLMTASGPSSQVRGLYTGVLTLMLTCSTVLLYRHWRAIRLIPALMVFLAFSVMLVTNLQGVLARWGVVGMLPLGPWGFALVPFALSLALGYESELYDRRLRQIIDHVPSIVSMRSLAGRYLLLNRYASEFFGVEDAQVVGRTGDDLRPLAPELMERTRQQYQQVLQAGHALEFEEDVPGPDGDRHFAVLRYPVCREDGQVIAVSTIASDVTARKRNERELAERRAHLEAVVAERSAEIARQRDEIAHLANHDALTGLPTLRLARDRLAQACAQATRTQGQAALLFIDLDGFKAANDTHGHEAGDQVLIVVARRLLDSLRAGDTAARQGGDEFIVVLNGVESAAAALAVAGKLLVAIQAPIYYHETVVPIGASIGIALWPDHADTPEALMRCADQAMYAVKKGGKNDCRLFAASVPEASDGAAERHA